MFGDFRKIVQVLGIWNFNHERKRDYPFHLLSVFEIKETDVSDVSERQAKASQL